ncbi:hypothetical protein TrRE_jg1881, partial [Triparma retinervis]
NLSGSDEAFSADDDSSETSDDEGVFEDPNEVANAVVQVQDLSDDEFEASGFSPTTVKMTLDWSKRWVTIMADLRADNSIPDPTFDNKVITKGRAIKFVAIDVASTNADGEYRFKTEKTYKVSHLACLKRWFYLGNNPDGIQYADQAESTWPHGLSRTLRNIAKNHFGHPNVTRALREQMREPIFEIDIQLACLSNNPVSPNFYHDFSIFFLTFQSGSRNSPMCKMQLSDIVHIRMIPDTCEIFVLLRFHELKAHAPGAEYMRHFSGFLHDHPNWSTDVVWHLHRYLIFRVNLLVVA